MTRIELAILRIKQREPHLSDTLKSIINEDLLPAQEKQDVDGMQDAFMSLAVMSKDIMIRYESEKALEDD